MKNIDNKFFLFSIYIFISIQCTNLYSQPKQRNSFLLTHSANCANITDYDLDGDNDLIIGHRIMWLNSNGTSDTSITIFNNTDGTTLVPIDYKTFPRNHNNLITCDVDNNGYPDIVTLSAFPFENYYNIYLRILYNDSGKYVRYLDTYLENSIPAQPSIKFIESGDFNGDGYQDLLVYADGTGNRFVMYNNKNAAFLAPVSFQFWGELTGDMAVADIDNDGYSDFVVTGKYTEIWFGSPGYPQGFQIKRIETDPNNVSLGDVAIADFDGDGDLDIFLYASLGMTYYIFYENIGNRNFIAHSMLYFLSGLGFIRVFDINNDGLPDIVSQNRDLGIEYLINNGDFTLSDKKIIPYPAPEFAAERYLDVGDLDGNGLVDLVLINFRDLYITYNTIDILYNDGNSNFRAEPFVPIIEKFMVTDTLLSTSEIDQENGVINVKVPYGTDITHLVPEMVLPYNAQTTPAVGDTVDFSQAVEYEVFFPSWGSKTYRVNVTIDSASVEMKSFGFENLQCTDSISQKANTVTVKVPDGTDLSNLIPTIVVADSATVSPPSGFANDFTHNQVYTVTNRLGIQRNYTITVKPNVGIDDVKEQIAFSVLPNFFADNFRVTYHLANESKINISLYNAKGQCVKVIVNKLQSSGDYNILVNDSQLIPCEIYFIKLSIYNQIIATEKLVKK